MQFDQWGNKGPKAISSVLALAMGLSVSPFAMAETEIEALRRELAEQKEIIRQILAAQQVQKETAAKVEAKVEAQAKAVAAAPSATDAIAEATKNLTFYGVLDGGFERITNVKNSVGGSSAVTRMPNITGSIPSRVGLRAAKEFAPGYKAIATAEMGFNFDDGTLGQSTTAGSTNGGSTSGARIFGRQLFAGIDTPYGAFTLGRQNSMLVYALGDADLLGPTIYSMGSLDAYLPNARFDNSIAWRGTFSKFTLGATFSTGRDTTGGAPISGQCAGETIGQGSACRGWSAMAKYDDKSFGVSTGVDEQRGGGTNTTAYFFNGAITSSMTGAAGALSTTNGPSALAFSRAQDFDRRTTVNGYVKLGPAKLGAGWLGREVNVLAGSYKSNIWFLDAAYKLNAKVSFDGGLYRITNHDLDRNATLIALRSFYNLDKDFDAYLQLAHIANSAQAAYAVSVGSVAPVAGASQTGTMVGLRYKF